MSKDLLLLLSTAAILLCGGGLSLGALALGSQELAMAILGFAGGLLSGTVFPALRGR